MSPLSSIETLNLHFRGASAEAILAHAVDLCTPDIAFACSLGLEDVVLVDLLSRLAIKPRIFILDTGRLPTETLETLDQIQNRYQLAVEVYRPDPNAVEAYVQSRGLNGFYESLEARRACCALRKVEPLGRALSGARAWITGLRREQAPTRSLLQPFEEDLDHGGILKVNPLAFWTLDQVWSHIQAHSIPYNPLHDRGYPSLGCEPCTRAIKPGEDIRAGRWWWERSDHKECGLHLRPSSVPKA